MQWKEGCLSANHPISHSQMILMKLCGKMSVVDALYVCKYWLKCKPTEIGNCNVEDIIFMGRCAILTLFHCDILLRCINFHTQLKCTLLFSNLKEKEILSSFIILSYFTYCPTKMLSVLHPLELCKSFVYVHNCST